MILNRKAAFKHLVKNHPKGILAHFQDEIRLNKNGSEIGTDPEISEFFGIVNELQNAIAKSLKDADAKKFGNEETLLLIRNVIGKYYALQSSPFRNAITKYIVTESKKYSSIHLNDGNTEQVWIGLR
jgi:hypothetical protein